MEFFKEKLSPGSWAVINETDKSASELKFEEYAIGRAQKADDKWVFCIQNTLSQKRSLVHLEDTKDNPLKGVANCELVIDDDNHIIGFDICGDIAVRKPAVIIQ